MIKLSNRWKRWIAPVVLGLGLCVAPAFSPPARAQAENADAESKEGRPFDGYIATSALLFLALFIVAKSARR
jgi:hypothetical protein